MNKTKITPAIYDAAVAIYSHTPNVQHKDVAEKLCISNKVLLQLRNQSQFWSDVYDVFMVSFEGEIIEVIRAMVTEGKNGNSSAARLVMEFSGKLKNHINIAILSPYEKWLAGNNIKDIKDAEIGTEPPAEIETKRNYMKLDKETQKKQEWNKRRRSLHKWKLRAKAVNIPPLPARRPTPGQRLAWEESIVRAEQEQG